MKKTNKGVNLNGYIAYYESETEISKPKFVYTTSFIGSFTRRITRLRNAALASRSAK
jgi:Uri superfamily endonuclease